MMSRLPEYVIDALDSGNYWDKDTITYSIPVNSSTWSYSEYSTHEEYAVFNTTQSEQFRKAITAWDELIAVDLIEVSEPSYQGDIRVAFSSQESGASGWASYPSNSARAGDVWINSKYKASLFEEGSWIYKTLLHEIGHALGLSHPFSAENFSPNNNTDKTTFFIDDDGRHHYLPEAEENRLYSLMSYTKAPRTELVNFDYKPKSDMNFSTLFRPETPMLYDIAAIQHIYGVDNTTRVGNTTYQFHDDILDQPFSKTLWDAGGIDTIDTTQQTQASFIDLAEGSFSSIGYFELNALKNTILEAFPQYKSWLNKTYFPENSDQLYTGKNNLAIAYGAIIENAIGGKGHDTLLGNQVDNQLTGHQGNDQLDGKGGIDTAIYHGNAEDYTIQFSAIDNTVTVKDLRGLEGVDTLTNIEYLRFDDFNVDIRHLINTPTIPYQAASVITQPIEQNTNYINYFLIESDQVFDQDLSLYYKTYDGTAKAGQDYIATSGVITLEAGQKGAVIGVEMIGDNYQEEDETFSLILSVEEDQLFAEQSQPLIATHTIIDNDTNGQLEPTITSIIRDSQRDASNDRANAGVINNTHFTGSVGHGNDSGDYYNFTAESSGIVNITLSDLNADIDLYLLDSEGDAISYAMTLDQESESLSAKITEGESYYVHIDPWGDAASSYTFDIDLPSEGSSNSSGDAGNEQANAMWLQNYHSMTGFVGFSNDTNDYFNFIAPSSGLLSATLTELNDNLNLKLLNASGELLDTSNAYGTVDESIFYELMVGETYTIHVDPWGSAESSYSLVLDFPLVYQDVITLV